MNRHMVPFGRLGLWSIVGIAVAAFAFWGVARVSGVTVPLWQVLLLALALLAVTSAVSALGADTEPGADPLTRTVNTPSWRPFIEVNRWEDQLIFAETKPGRFEGSTAKRNLIELADERLRLRRGLSLAADPDQCRDLLGEDTYAFLTRPVADCPTTWQLDAHLKHIEEI
ncbi:hypothetical protein [Glycomyces buryatensis]|uniref:Uncharacterized protein n=1 Tax=Glycomyces buryatensis TaxID=2570927 RepID=A0A4S8QIU5_9ACTN|nr:hypothetical protein [Glycomyces buryatensis]THV43182.1 hypothetical protein FAB82_02835 [Glycomyces buryatensis]